MSTIETPPAKKDVRVVIEYTSGEDAGLRFQTILSPEMLKERQTRFAAPDSDRKIIATNVTLAEALVLCITATSKPK